LNFESGETKRKRGLTGDLETGKSDLMQNFGGGESDMVAGKRESGDLSTGERKRTSYIQTLPFGKKSIKPWGGRGEGRGKGKKQGFKSRRGSYLP